MGRINKTYYYGSRKSVRSRKSKLINNLQKAREAASKLRASLRNTLIPNASSTITSASPPTVVSPVNLTSGSSKNIASDSLPSFDSSTFIIEELDISYTNDQISTENMVIEAIEDPLKKIAEIPSTSHSTDQNKSTEDMDSDSNDNIMDNLTISYVKNQESSSGDEVKLFCPNCNTEVPHSTEKIQEDQTKILVAKVYHYFELEFEELKKIYVDLDLTPLSNFRQRTALATGVSETTVLQILKEEEERNADKRQEPPETRRRARKRPRQTESSSEEDSSDDNIDDGGQSSFVQLSQNEPEIETLVVKLEPPEHYREQAQSDPLWAEVKAEPTDDDQNDANESLALNEPAGTQRRARKIPRSDVTSTPRHTQGQSTSAAAASIARFTQELHESGLLGENEVKVENIEAEEEGFS